MRIIRVRTEIKLFLLLWLLYALYATPAGGVQPNRYIDLTHSIVNEGRFEIDTYHDNTIDKVYVNGHYYIAALPGPSIWAVPIYVVFKQIYPLMPSSLLAQANSIQSFKQGELRERPFYRQVDQIEFFLSQFALTIFLVGALSAVAGAVFYSFARLLGAAPMVSLLTSIAYAWGTHAFFFSTTFFEQVLTGSLAILVFYFIHFFVASRRTRVRDWFTLGCLAGLLLASEYFGAILIFFFFLYIAFHLRGSGILFFCVGVVVPVLFFLLYNFIILGNPFDSPNFHLGEYFDFEKEGIAGMSYPRLERAIGVLFGNSRGLFIFAPITLLGLAGIWVGLHSRQQRAIAAFCALVFAAGLIYNAAFCCWDTASFGPKYFVPVLPFLILPLALVDWTTGVKRWLFGATLGVSIFINWLGAQFGFAESVNQHIQELTTRGPTLAIFDAILMHSTTRTRLYLFAEQYHIVITLGATSALLILFVIVFRNIWRPESYQRIDGIYRPNQVIPTKSVAK